MTNNPLHGGDTQPWYRQFWPWFLILLPAIAVVASLFTVYIANRDADDLVVDDYYKTGLAINRQLEKKQLSEDLGISAQLSFTGTHVTARVSGPVENMVLSLSLSHPMEADRDFRMNLNRIAPGIFQGVLPTAVSPRWHWTLGLDQPGGWRLDGDIKDNDIGNVAIE